MKNTAKILVLVLTLALLTVGLVIGVAAEDEITYVDEVNGITEIALDGNPTGVRYLVYPNEATFKADAEDHVINGTGATIKTDDKMSAFEGLSANRQYVYMLTDNVGFPATHNGNFLVSGVFTVDLGGHTTTLDRMVQFEGGALTIQNGTVNSTYTGNSFQSSGNNNNLTLRNLNFTNKVSGGAFYRGTPNTGADHSPTLTIDKCNIYFGDGGNAQFIYVGESKEALRYCTVKISDSDITFNVNNNNHHFIVDEYNPAGKGYFTNVYIKNTKFNTTAGCSAKSTDYATVNRINVYFDKNTVVRNGMFRAQNRDYTGYSAGITYNVIDEFDENWNFDTSKVYATVYTDANKTQAIATFYTGTVWSSVVNAANDNAYMELGEDVNFVFIDNGVAAYTGSFTVNLNGKAMTRSGNNEGNARFGAPAAGKTLKFYNGKINWSARNLAYATAGGNIVFENVDVTMKDNYLFDLRNGNLTFNGGSITRLGNRGHGAINVGEDANATTNVQLLGTDISNFDHAILVSNRKDSVTTANVTIAANGEDVPVIDCNYLFSLNCGGAVLPGTSTTVTVTDALVNNAQGLFGGTAFTTTDGSAFNGTYTFSNTKLAKYDDELGNVTFGEGERLMTLTGDATYNYVVDTPVINTEDIKVNLSLYSYFKINVFVPVTGTNIAAIDGVKLGEDVEIQKIGDVDYYAIPLTAVVAPTTALDKVTFSYGYTDADDGEGVYRSLNVKYSVYNYFASYFAENTNEEDLGYILNKDVMVYIRAAYAAKGAATAEFDALIGEDYESDFAFDANKTQTPAKDIVTGATFIIEDDNTIILELSVSADAEITVKAGGEEYVAVNDDAGKKRVSIRAFALADQFTIYANGQLQGTYSLDAYYNRTAGELTEAQKTLVEALGAFVKSCKLYKQSIPQD